MKSYAKAQGTKMVNAELGDVNSVGVLHSGFPPSSEPTAEAPRHFSSLPGHSLKTAGLTHLE